MKKLILLMFLGLISSPLFAQQSRLVYLPNREAPVNCLYESKSYLCMDGETYLYGSDFGGDITFAGVIDGTASSMISAEKVVAESNPDEVLFEKAEPSIFIYTPKNQNPEPVKPTLAMQTTTLSLTLGNLDSPYNPFNKSLIDKVKEKFLSLISENNDAYARDNRIVTLDDGSELSCKREKTVSKYRVYQTYTGTIPLKCELFDCEQKTGDNKGKSFSLISNPDPRYPASSLFSVDEKGLPHYIQPEQIDIVGVDKPLFKKIKPFKMLDAGDYAPYGQMPQGMIDMNYQKPQITMDMTAPNLGDSEINAVANMTSMGLENQIKMNLDACSPDAYKPLLDSFNKLEDAILNNELVQYVTELNSGLAGFYLSPQDIPEFACSKDGVYYNRKVFEDAQSVRSEQSIEDVAITPEEAQKLFDMAQGMEDIAWGYKMDGCYAVLT